MTTRKYPKQKVGKSVNGKTAVVGVRMMHAAIEELKKRGQRRGYEDLGSYLRHLLEEFALHTPDPLAGPPAPKTKPGL